MFWLIVWFAVWLINGIPEVHMWNVWAISLTLAILALIFG